MDKLGPDDPEQPTKPLFAHPNHLCDSETEKGLEQS